MFLNFRFQLEPENFFAANWGYESSEESQGGTEALYVTVGSSREVCESRTPPVTQ